MNPDVISQVRSAVQAGRALQAEQLCREALKREADNEMLLVLLAISLQMQQRPLDAMAIYAELTRLHPASSVHWSNYGTALFENNRLESAEQALSKAAALNPDSEFPKIYLGLIKLRQRDYPAARHLLLDAFEINRRLPFIRIHAAKACCLCQDFQGSVDLLASWREWLPLNDDKLQLELAQVLTLQDEAMAAIGLLEDVLERQPGLAEANLLLATLYERSGRMDEARSLAKRVADATPPETDDLRIEAEHILATIAARRGDLLLARELLEKAGPQTCGDYSHYFELAAVCDKLGDTQAVMPALRQAHKLAREEFSLGSPEYFEPSAPPLPFSAMNLSIRQGARWPLLAAPGMANSPVFVVGFPRSGTTLLEQMLDAHPDLQSMDEKPFFDRLADVLRRHDPGILDDLGRLQQQDVDHLRKRYEAMVAEKVSRRSGTRLVDKNPLNMLWLPLIYRLFPEAKFILAVRHPCDVVLSCYMQDFRSSVLAAACSDLERLAHAYVEVMQRWLDAVETWQPDVMASRYEDLVTVFPLQASRIAQFLGLEDASPMLQFDRHASRKGYIGTPSYSQVVEPVNRKGVGRWHKYRRDIESILPILEPMIRHWGYTTEPES